MLKTASWVHRHLVAVVDGSATHRAEVARALFSFYAVTEYPSVGHAIAAFQVAKPAVVLIGDRLGPQGIVDLANALGDTSALKDIPVVMVIDRETDESLPDALGAQAYLVRPYRRSTLIHVISDILNRNIETQWESLPETQRSALKNTLSVFNSVSDVIDRGEPIAYKTIREACSPLVDAIHRNEFRTILSGVREHDNYSYAHSLRVATLLSLFGHVIGLPQADQMTLATGGLLHDVGKLSIPYEVLNKPDRLSPSEWEVMKSHVEASLRYLNNTPDLPKGILVIAGQHHEKLNGEGYPNGLTGDELNELARMASIVDVFGALTDRRSYKPPMPAEEALRIMTEQMTTHLDSRLLGLFREMLLDAVID